jgi:hypothetical protein
MSEQGVIGIYDSISKAEEAVYKLDRGGFPTKQVSIVAQHLQSERRVNGYVTVSDVGRTDAMTGAWLGGLVGLPIRQQTSGEAFSQEGWINERAP